MSSPNPLTSLPPELRNSIYIHALASHARIFLNIHKKRNAPEKVVAVYPYRMPSVALLATSGQIHTEATPILYGLNTFANYDHPRVFASFHQLLTPFSWKCIRTITLCGEFPVDNFLNSLSVLEHAEGLCEVEFVRRPKSALKDEEIARILGPVTRRMGLEGLRFTPGGIRPTREDWEVTREREEEVKKLLRGMMD